jgi:hypothetical protein
MYAIGSVSASEALVLGAKRRHITVTLFSYNSEVYGMQAV